MTIQELHALILSNTEDFDKFLREHFDFRNVRLFKNNALDFNRDLVIIDDFITVHLINDDEIIDHVYLSLTNPDKHDKEYTWNGITIFAHQYVDDSW